MRGGFDDGAVGISARVTAHAEVVPGEDEIERVRVMAIETADAGVMHSAAEKRGELVVFVPDLSIGIIDIGVIGEGEREVIVVGFSRDEIAG
jgi:hypothetical protein